MNVFHPVNRLRVFHCRDIEIDDHRAMMMRTGLGIRMNGHCTGPDFLGTDAQN